MEYRILDGGEAPYGVNELAHLEKLVNDVLAEGGSTVGGVFIEGRNAYQAVMKPVDKNNAASGGRYARKTRKQRR